MKLLPQFAESLRNKPILLLDDDHLFVPRINATSLYVPRREMTDCEYYKEVLHTGKQMFGDSFNLDKKYFDALRRVGMQLYGDKRNISDYL